MKIAISRTTKSSGLPVKPSREETPARRGSQQAPRLDQRRTPSLRTRSARKRLLVVPLERKASVLDRVPVKVSDAAKKIGGHGFGERDVFMRVCVFRLEREGLKEPGGEGGSEGVEARC